MIILACETSTLLGSVAIIKDGQVLSAAESPRQNSHSDMLNLFVHQALEKAQLQLSDIDLFVSGIGPGSFTGIRISLNTIKSYAYCFNKPVIGINSLQSLAFQVKNSVKGSEIEKYPIVSMINAYKNMAYVSTHQLKNSQMVELKKPEVVRIQNLATYISENSLVCGDAYLAYEKYIPEETKQNIIRIQGLTDEPNAITAAGIAHENPQLKQDWNSLVPLYLRSSEAEENLKGIKYQPLF